MAAALIASAVRVAEAQDAAPAPAPEAEPAQAPQAAEPAAGDAPAPAPEAIASTEAAPADAIQVTVVGTPLARTAGSAHVVRSAQLERFKHDDPHAVLQSVPGVYVRGEDGFGLRPNIGIRGVNPDRSKKVTLLEDGVLFGPAPYSAPAAYFFPMMARMTQVRVIKGPASVSYGPQTVGGAIDLITRPIPDSTSGGLDLAGGSFGYRKAHGHFGTSDGQMGFLVEGLHLSTEGFKELPGAADTGFYRNEWMVKGAYAFDTEGEAQNELRLKLTYSDELSNESYLGLAEEDFEDNPLMRYEATALDRMRNHRTSIVATHVLAPSKGVSVTTNVYRHDFYRVWRKVNGLRGLNLFDVLSDPNADDTESRGYIDLLRGDADDDVVLTDDIFIGPNERDFVSQGVETRMRLDCKTGPFAHRMEYGVRLHHDRVDRRHSQDVYNLIGGEPVPAQNIATDITALNSGVTYALAVHAIDAITWEALTLTPGIRFETQRAALESEGATAGRWSRAFVPGVGAYYALTQELGVLAGVYRGFSPVAPGSPEDVAPELSWNYEAGARYTRGAARAEVIGFYNDYTNLTDTCTFSSGCSDAALDMQFDAGEALIYGLEAYADYAAPLPAGLKLPITLAYTATATEFRRTFESDDPIFGEVVAGDEIPYVPRHQLSATLGLEHERAGGSVSATYVSAMRETPGTEPLEDVIATDEQLVLDAALYYRAESMPLELYAIAHNLLDRAYVVSRRPFGARPNAPLSVQVGVKVEL